MLPGKVWQEFIDATEGMSAAEFINYCHAAFEKNYIQELKTTIAMYQGRREDFDPRVDQILEEGPKIQKAFEEIEEKLRQFYNAKDNSTAEVRIFTHYTYYTHILPSNLPDPWDYTKEFAETLDKLNHTVLDAYITFLEGEREDLIQRWNQMAKKNLKN